MRAGCHNHGFGFFRTHTGDFNQLVRGELGQIVACGDVGFYQVAQHVFVHAVQIFHYFFHAVELFFGFLRGLQHHVARFGAQAFCQFGGEAFQLFQFGSGYIRHFFHAFKSACHKGFGNGFFHAQCAGEEFAQGGIGGGILLLCFLQCEDIELHAGQFGGKAYVLSAASDGECELVFRHNDVH